MLISSGYLYKGGFALWITFGCTYLQQFSFYQKEISGSGIGSPRSSSTYSSPDTAFYVSYGLFGLFRAIALNSRCLFYFNVTKIFW